MLGANIGSVGWPSCGEIDIMEAIKHMVHVIGMQMDMQNMENQLEILI